MFRIRLIFIFLLVSIYMFGQKLNPNAIKGDRMYRDSNYVESEEAYRKANAENPCFNFQYNLANSLYQQGRIKEAQTAYEKSISNSSTPAQQLSSAYYNLGNTNFHNKAYDKSIEAYKESLKLNPKDADAKINLAQAKRMKLQQQQEQQKNQQQDQKQQEQKQQDQKDQNQQEQQNQDQKKEQQKEEQKSDQKKIDNSQDENKDKKEDQSGTENKQMTKDEANQLLKMVDDKDKKVIERLQQKNRRRVPKDKDW